MEKKYQRIKSTLPIALIIALTLVMALVLMPLGDVSAESNDTWIEAAPQKTIGQSDIASIYADIYNIFEYIPKENFSTFGLHNESYGNYGYFVNCQSLTEYGYSGYVMIYQFVFEYDYATSMIRSSIHNVYANGYHYKSGTDKIKAIENNSYIIRNVRFRNTIFDANDYSVKKDDTPFITYHRNEFNAKSLNNLGAMDAIELVASIASPLLGTISPAISVSLTVADIIATDVKFISGNIKKEDDNRSLVAEYPITKQQQLKTLGQVMYGDYYCINDAKKNNNVFYGNNRDHGANYLEENGYTRLLTRVSSDNFYALSTIEFDLGYYSIAPIGDGNICENVSIGKVINKYGIVDTNKVENVSEYEYSEDNTGGTFRNVDNGTQTLAFDNKKAQLRFIPSFTGYYTFETENKNVNGFLNDEIGRKSIREKSLCLAGKEYIIEFRNTGDETFDRCKPVRVPYIDRSDTIYHGISFIEYIPVKTGTVHVRFGSPIQLFLLDSDLKVVTRGNLLGENIEMSYNFIAGKTYYFAMVNGLNRDLSNTLEIGVQNLEHDWVIGDNVISINAGMNYIPFIPSDSKTYQFSIDGMLEKTDLVNENFISVDNTSNRYNKTLNAYANNVYYLLLQSTENTNISINLYKSEADYIWYIDGKKVVKNATGNANEIALNEKNTLELERGKKYKIDIYVDNEKCNYILVIKGKSYYKADTVEDGLVIDANCPLYGDGFDIEPKYTDLSLKVMPILNLIDDTKLSINLDLKKDTVDVTYTSQIIWANTYETQNIKLNINNAVYSISSNNGIFNYHHVIKDVGEECALNIYIEELTITTREHQSMVINVSEKGKRYYYDTTFIDGSGSVNSPILIYTPRQFLNIYEYTKYDDIENAYKLMQDINLKGWKMPTYLKEFRGFLYGESKTVTTYDNLFDVNYGEIKSLFVRNLSSVDLRVYKVGIAMVNRGLIDDCFVKSMSMGKFGISGVCSWNDKTGTIQNCIVQAGIYSTDSMDTGGVAGFNEGIIKNCQVNANVSKSTSNTNENFIVGGVVGLNKGIVVNSSNTYMVWFLGPKTDSRTFAPYIGGAIGKNEGSMSNCTGTADKGELRVVKWGVWPFNNGSWDQAQHVHNN